MIPIGRPEPAEYSQTVAHYIARVPEDDPLASMAPQVHEFRDRLSHVTEAAAGHRYAPGKWTIRQTVGHLADTERILGYRALCLARGERAPLPGFDENAYVDQAPFEARTLADLLAEFAAVRESTRHLFDALGADAWLRRGVANGNPISVRGLAYTIVGHVRHHTTILEERYFPGLPQA
jgi:hypothetical protein